LKNLLFPSRQRRTQYPLDKRPLYKRNFYLFTDELRIEVT
jgi:hypothetical protein